MSDYTQNKKVHNFFSGPAILPITVLKKAANAVVDFKNTGLSILEISHRSKEFLEVLEKTYSLVKEILDIPSTHEVLFLTGGARSQFFMTAMNLLYEDGTAGYINTGTWSTQAIKEAKHFGNVIEIASSADKKFKYIPKEYTIPKNLTYLHFTSNNTIYGTQFHKFPQTDIPLVCDMSSDIFSRPIDIERFGLIYAGAQKNLGPAGTTLVIVKKELLEKNRRTIPTMLDYRRHIEKLPTLNTPPVYPIFVCMLTLEWIKSNGGITAIQERNRKKAALLYNEIDNNPLFKGWSTKDDRSLMNVTFDTSNSYLQEQFLKMTTEANCVGVQGHRSVGGLRASIYNAMDITSVEVLRNVMKEFGQKFG